MNKVFNTTQSCIFCQINRDQSAHFLIAKSNSLRAVLDIHPITEGHLLILSRSHVSHLEELNDDEYKELFLFAKKLGLRVIEAFDDVNDYTLVVNNGTYSGQHIPHAHIHLIPRRKWDNINFYWRLLTRFINPTVSKRRLLKVSQKLKSHF
ncbi:HIT family protein [Vibrio splendidus]|uniref:HIT family protein n=1 Tax=Vibrio splendidus TaxID=29497 RepID=UPI000C842853|nr:HIT family protein [Vibrio splendidus]PMK36334.1 diadenosine tetraphosphate hydrolase [Vibrio splendidus]